MSARQALVSLTDTRRYLPVEPVVHNAAGNRDPLALTAVLLQHSVTTNPRYTPGPPGSGITWCNIALWDITRAMGAEIPHWVAADGSPAQPGPPASELTANKTVDWLVEHGARHGWAECGSAKAQDAANRGEPAVAVWKSPPGKHGHVAVVRPGTLGAGGPRLWQAGALCFEDASAAECFGSREVRYFTHA